MKAVLRKKFIVVNSPYREKTTRTNKQPNVAPQASRKRKQDKPKAHKGKEIIKIRA